MTISLPNPIAGYFAADKAADMNALGRCFVNDAVVRDEGGTFTGVDAIKQWNAAARAKYHYTVEPLSIRNEDDAFVVIGKLTGDFPNSPIELEHVFRLAGDQIASLEIG